MLANVFPLNNYLAYLHNRTHTHRPAKHFASINKPSTNIQIINEARQPWWRRRRQWSGVLWTGKCLYPTPAVRWSHTVYLEYFFEKFAWSWPVYIPYGHKFCRYKPLSFGVGKWHGQAILKRMLLSEYRYCSREHDKISPESSHRISILNCLVFEYSQMVGWLSYCLELWIKYCNDARYGKTYRVGMLFLS